MAMVMMMTAVAVAAMVHGRSSRRRPVWLLEEVGLSFAFHLRGSGSEEVDVQWTLQVEQQIRRSHTIPTAVRTMRCVVVVVDIVVGI